MLDGELIREALHRLYDPPALASARLAGELIGQGSLKAPDGLHGLLLSAIERLRPPGHAPPQSHAWRRYRYVQLRYVECLAHEAVATDLRLSLRQASRVHQEALAALEAILLPPLRRRDGSGADGGRAGAADGSSWDVALRSDALWSAGSSQRARGRGRRELLDEELAEVNQGAPTSAVDVGEVVRGVVDTLDRMAASHGATIEVALPSSLPPVGLDRVVLRQVLLHLLQYRLGGGDVSLGAEHVGPAVVVTLVGGRATDDASLAAARQMAAVQGAEVQPLDGGGHALRLPLGAVRTVLVVDDNPDVGDLFRRMLVRSWYHPIPVRSAVRALRLAAETPPDAIVLDVVMPGQDGWEVLSALQADPRTASIPVVVCSVLPDRELALSLGAADFIAKPITRSVLLDVLGGLLTPKP